MPTTQVGDLTVYYEEHGEGKPIVLHHGLAGSSEQWRPVLGTLRDLGYRAIAFDQRGHGRTSDGTKAFTIPQLVEDLRGLMDHLKLQRATLLGHSMGGRTALLFAMNHPERVETLILNGAGGSPPTGDARAAFELFVEVARKVKEVDFSKWLGKSCVLVLTRGGGRRRCRQPAQAVAGARRAALHRRDHHRRISKVRGKGRGARAALSADSGFSAERRRDHRHPAGAQSPL